MNQNANIATTTPTHTMVTPSAADALAQGLAAALLAGNVEKAADLATELAHLSVKCEIRVLHEANKQRSKQAEFTVNVHMEDRVTDRCYINVKVKAFDTIGDLKRKMMISHNLPMEVQRWIIGKKIHPDHTTLYQCGVRGPGHTLYLYLVTARSVGLNKADYEVQRQAIMLMNQAGRRAAPHQSSPAPSNQSASLDPASSFTSNNSDNFDQTPVVPLKLGMYAANPSSSSVSPGSARIQEMLLSPHLSGFLGNPSSSGTPGTPVETVLAHASPGLNGDAWAVNSSTTPTSSMSTPTSAANVASSNSTQEDQREPVVPLSAPCGPPTEDDEETEGWECPACTYLNLPMWPGCEICNCQRPEEYQVPDNYQLTEREKRLKQDEQMMLNEPLVPGVGQLQHQWEPEVMPGQPAKLRGQLELLQNSQTAGVAPSNNNVNRTSNIFDTNNSLILRNISDEQGANERRIFNPHPADDLNDVLQALKMARNTAKPGEPRSGSRQEAHDLVDGDVACHTADTTAYDDYSSDEENFHA